jgi:hypothetical protein
MFASAWMGVHPLRARGLERRMGHGTVALEAY